MSSGYISKIKSDIPLRADASTNTLQVIDYDHHEVHGGSHFHLVYSVADMGAMTTPNDTITVTFNTPNTTKWIHLVIAAVAGTGARFQFIEGGTGGGASPTGELSVYNSNRNSAGTSVILATAGGNAAKVSYDATVVTGGTSLVDEYIGADGIGNTFAGGTSRGEQEWILKQNTQYQLVLTDTASVPGRLMMSWYEHTDIQ